MGASALQDIGIVLSVLLYRRVVASREEFLAKAIAAKKRKRRKNPR
jgi:hypothetical protein